MSAFCPRVIVLGAGPAGIAACAAISRAGGHATLLEKLPQIGGAATQAMVGTICGLSVCSQNKLTALRLDNPGFASEFARVLMGLSRSTLHRNSIGLTYLPYRPDDFLKIAAQFTRLPHIDVKLGVTIRALRRESERKFQLQTDTEEIFGEAVIDCSGDMVSAEYLGNSVIVPSDYQAAAQIFSLTGLPALSETELALLFRKRLFEGAKDALIDEDCTFVSVVPGSTSNTTAYFKLGTDAPQHNVPNKSEVGIRTEAVKNIEKIVGFIRASGPPFETTALESFAPTLGVRSGRRGVGLTMITEENVKSSKQCSDGIALGFWPIERWNTPAKPEILFPSSGICYEIPLGALCSKELPGVYFAGRSISACDYAIASARVIGTSFSTGYAAGYAAVRYAANETTQRIVKELREEQIAPFYAQM